MKFSEFLYESFKFNIFSRRKHPVEDATYTPSFLKDRLKQRIFNRKLPNLKNLFKISSKTINGTNISVDANDDERKLDMYLKTHNLMK